MTIPAGETGIDQYIGNGVADTFDYKFVIKNKNELRVVKTDLDDVDSDLTLDVDYTVSGVGDAGGGTITLSAPLETDYTLTIIDDVQISQEIPFGNQSKFAASLHESAFDKQTRINIRQQSKLNNNTLRLPETVLGVSPELPKPRGLALFRYNSDGDALETVLPEEIATSVAFSDYNAEQFVDGVDFTAGSTDFLEMAMSPGIKNNTQIYFDGVYQEKDTYEMETPTRVRFDSAIPGSISIVEIVYGTAIPSDQTLAAEAFADAASASATAAASSASAASSSAGAAASSASAAASSESAAASSASAASSSAASAATSASNAATSESNAATSESNAATSASAAATSESNAADSETEAAASAAAAAASASPGMNQAEFEAVAESNRRKFAGSGFAEWGKAFDASSDNEVINEGMWTAENVSNVLRLGGDTDLTLVGESLSVEPVVSVDGCLVEIKATNSPGTRVYSQVDLPPTPDGLDKKDGTGRFADLAAAIAAGGTSLNASVIDRQDLVGLEVWHEAIDTNGAVYPFGNVQYGVSSYQGISLSSSAVVQGYSAFGEWDISTTGYGAAWNSLSDAARNTFLNRKENNIYRDAETGKLIQVRYRIRSIAGNGPEWFCSSNLEAEEIDFDWIAKDSSSLIGYRGSKLNAPDVLTDTDAAIMTSGREEWFDYSDRGVCINREVEGRDTSDFCHNGKCYFIPIALVSRRNQGAYHPVLNPNGTKYVANDSNGDGTINTFGDWNSSVTKVSSLSQLFDEKNLGDSGSAGADARPGRGAIAGGASGISRPDEKFYDAIYAGDVKDLRLSARRKSKSDIREEWKRKAIAAEVRGFETNPQWEVVSVSEELLADNASTRTFTADSSFSASIGDFVIIQNGSDFAYGYLDDATPGAISVTDIRENAIADTSSGELFNRTQGATTTIYKLREGLQFQEQLQCDVIGDPANYYSGQDYTQDGTSQTVDLIEGETVVYYKVAGNGDGDIGHYYRRIAVDSTTDINDRDFLSSSWADLGTTYDGQDWTNDGSSQTVDINTGEIVYQNDPTPIGTGEYGHYYRRIGGNVNFDLSTFDYGGSSWVDLGRKYRGQQWTNDGSGNTVDMSDGEVIYNEAGGASGIVGHFYQRIGSASFPGDIGVYGDETKFIDLGPDWNGSRAAGSWLQDGIPGFPLLTHADTGESLIPDGTTKPYKLSRKVKDAVLWLQSTDNGVTWTDATSSVGDFEGPSNSRDTTNTSDYLEMIFYTTDAHFTEESDNAVVDSLGSVIENSDYRNVRGASIGNSLLGKVQTSTSTPSYYEGELIGKTIGGSFNEPVTNAAFYPVHHPISLSNPNGSPAIKVLDYLTHENGRYYLQLAYKQLKWDLDQDSIGDATTLNFQSPGTNNFTVGDLVRVISNSPDGNENGYFLVVQAHSTSTVGTFYQLGGNLYLASNNSLLAVGFDGTGWGDDKQFDIVDGTDAATNLNGETVLIGQARFALPYLTGEDN